MGRARGGYDLREAKVLARSKKSLFIGILMTLGGCALTATASPITGYLLMGGVLAFVYWAGFGGANAVPAKVQADAAGLWIDDRLALSRAAIKYGRVVERMSRPPRVELRARGLRLNVRLLAPDVKSARALLKALGIDRREGTRRFTLPSWTFGTRAAVAAVVLSLFGFFCVVWMIDGNRDPSPSSLVWIAATALCVFFVSKRATRLTMTIAKDGLLLERFRRSEFIRFDQIASLERAPGEGKALVSPGFVVVLTSGRRIPLYTLEERTRGEGMYVGDHVMEALATVMKSVRRSDTIRVLARGGRSARDWLAALRTAAESRSYRQVPVAPKDLFDVLRDASATDEMRAASAAALASLDDPKIRKRLLGAADDMASPKVRATLEAALASNEERMLAALEAASAPEDGGSIARERS